MLHNHCHSTKLVYQRAASVRLCCAGQVVKTCEQSDGEQSDGEQSDGGSMLDRSNAFFSLFVIFSTSWFSIFHFPIDFQTCMRRYAIPGIIKLAIRLLDFVFVIMA